MVFNSLHFVWFFLVVYADVSPDVLGLADLPRALGAAARRPLMIVHLCEACYDNLLIVPRLSPVVRYSIYAATFYLTMPFGNFGGAEFICFQF